MNPSRADRLQTFAWAAAGIALIGLFWLLGPILAPFVIGAVFAYICDPAVNWMVARRVPRALAVLLVIVALGLLLVALALILVPMVYREGVLLVRRLPDLIEMFNAQVSPLMLARLGIDLQLDAAQFRQLIADNWTSAQDIVPIVLGHLKTGGMAVLAFIAILFLVPLVMFYLLQEWPRLLDELQRIVPRPWLERTMRILNDIDSVMSEFLRGQLSVMMLLAVIYSVGLWLAGLNFWLPVGVLTGLLVFIPYVGFGGGLILAILAALLQAQGWPLLAGVAIVYGLGQLVESFLLTPYLVGERIGLHPLAVIFALMAFGQLFEFAADGWGHWDSGAAGCRTAARIIREAAFWSAADWSAAVPAASGKCRVWLPAFGFPRWRVEQSFRCLQQIAVAAQCGGAQVGAGCVHQFVGEGVGKEFQGLVRTLAAGQQVACLGQGFVATCLGIAANAGDGIVEFKRPPPGHEVLDRKLDHRLRFDSRLLARAQVFINHFAQVINAVEEHVGQLGHLGFNVARHGQVDQEHGTRTTCGNGSRHHLTTDHRFARGGGGNDDVRFGQMPLQVGQGNGITAKPASQRLRVVEGAVGDNQALHLGRRQVTCGKFDGFTCADQQHAGIGEVGENPLGQAHGGECDRDRIGADAGIGANPLGHREGVLEQALQRRIEGACVAGHVVRTLDLAQDLRFAEHHRLKASGDAEQVAHRIGLGVAIEELIDIGAVQLLVAVQPLERRGLRARIDVAVKLGTIAGREDHRLAHARLGHQITQGADRVVRAECRPFAQGDRGAKMIESECDQGHGCDNRLSLPLNKTVSWVVQGNPRC